MPNLNDSERREKLLEDEMAKLRAGRSTFKPEQWLLYMLCATTGMRRGEAYSIDREHVEHGIRYVIVGTKTDQSLRRVPLPDAVLPLLPARIDGPLFTQDLKNLGRETLRQMRRLGVTKDIHGLRHRAKDRLRAAGVPLDVQYHILGHEERTVAAGYGHGYPVSVLKDAVEKIGFWKQSAPESLHPPLALPKTHNLGGWPVSRQRLERAMRVLLVQIEEAWDRGDLEQLQTFMYVYLLIARRHVMH